ncbi:MAG TPA: DUF3450 domain-containing protein [Gammaproteobacteria bacterium]|nr:DUF3450 domain-containing protein [Gammaproteobacteria bacterium]
MRNFPSSTRTVSNTFARRRPALYGSICAIVATLAVATAFPAMSADKNLDDILVAMNAVNQAAAKSQQKINALTDQTEDAATKYAQALAEARSYEQYAKQLTALVKSQQDQVVSINQQLKGIEGTRRGIAPLMNNMVQTLADFVSLDLPFQKEEREQRVQDLKDLMSRADVAISEKYRLILQDYLTELDYGRDLGTYDGTLGSGKNAKAVQFVRIGRICLMYQTLDGSETGYWDANQKKWVVDNSYAQAFKEAVGMANQKGTPQLLTVPVPAPQPASQEAKS